MGAATATTSMSTVAGALVADPSFTVKVNESDPWKVAAGVYVTSAVQVPEAHVTVPMEPSEPWVGPVPIAKERVSPSASVPDRVTVLAVSSFVETDGPWATGAWLATGPDSIVTSRSSGVRSGSVVASWARYWMNRDVAPIESPGLATGTKELHVPSGTAVSPVRTLMFTVVPAGVPAVQLIAPHSASAPASKTRDREVPEVEYGDIRIQSTVTSGAPLPEAATGRMFWAMVTFWVSTTWPSIENTTCEAPQSMR